MEASTRFNQIDARLDRIAEALERLTTNVDRLVDESRQTRIDVSGLRAVAEEQSRTAERYAAIIELLISERRREGSGES